MKRTLARGLAAALSLWSFGAGVAVAADIQVTGEIAFGGTNEPTQKLTFSCFGVPTCNGLYTELDKDPGCSNSFAFTDAFRATGLNLSQPGPISGQMTFFNGSSSARQPNGTCIYSRNANTDVLAYSGHWDGKVGIFTVGGTDSQGHPFSFNGTLKADIPAPAAPPVFRMDVTAAITPAVANASAQIQFRPQDVGTTGSVYVFALAPATTVKDAALAKAQPVGPIVRARPEDDPVPCVLAQVGSDGQLHGVASASSLQPSVTGVLSAQGAAVNVLNNVPTPNLSGATMFVGYGPDATTMVNSGVNRPAVTIPGEVSCAPQAPQTGWWWNPLEGGRGFSIEVQGNNLFFAAFHYEANGRATWNVSPGPISLGGARFTSDLYNVTGGQTLGGAFKPATAARVGAITLDFADASHGTMTWPGGTVPIERQPFAPGSLALAPLPNQPESGWWWNPSENGRGFFIEWQGGTADIAGYMYDDLGNPVWYIAVYPTPNPRVFTGNWWTFANGQSMSGTYHPATQTSNAFAPLTINFTGPDTAVMQLPGGRTTSLVRQRF